MTPSLANPPKQERPVALYIGGLEYFSIRDYWTLLVRRKALVAAATVAITLPVAIFAYFLPNQYSATAQIMVDPGKVPESYVKPTATIDASQRLAILQEQILSDAKLGQIIDELGLYRSLKAKNRDSDIVQMMRQKIDISTTTSAAPSKPLKAFNVTFTAPNPALAAKVANRLASLFIEENLKVRELQVIGTADFFNDQLQKAKQELDDKTQRLEKLRARYSAELPESQSTNVQALNLAELAYREEADAADRAKQRKEYLQSLLASSPNVIDLDSTNSGLAEQLERLQSELDQLRRHYGPDYPDVLSKLTEIDNVKRTIKQLADRGGDATTPAMRKHSNPAIESQIAEAEEEIKKHEARQAELDSKRKFLQAAVEQAPAVQQQIAEAGNDVANASDRYKRLEDHKFSADMFSDVEARQQAERFVLLDPAEPPEHPASPDRLLIDAAGTGVGLVISLLLVILLEIIEPTVKTEREVLDRLKVPVFGEIPRMMRNDSVKRRFWTFGTGAVSTFLLAALPLFLRRVIPRDTV